MSVFRLLLTDKGLSALVDASVGTTNAVSIATIGLTATRFLAVPTLTALPGEFVRIAAVAGQAVDDRTIHMTMRDDGEGAYAVRGFGLYLNNGVLFAVYVQDDPIFEKSSVSSFLVALDITLRPGDAALIQFGSANFLYPPASETRKGVAQIATPDQVAEGSSADTIVTPARLKAREALYIPVAKRGVANGVASLDETGKVPPGQMPKAEGIDTFTAEDQAEMLALPASLGDFARRPDLEKTFTLKAMPPTVLGNWIEFLSPGAPVQSVNGKIGNVVLAPADVGAVPVGRQVATGGLAIGGGDQTVDRTITVPAASAAEALAGLIGDKAVTPAALASILALIATLVPQARTVTGGGLVDGGGDLDANRVLTVAKATGADVQAGIDDTRALTSLSLFGTLRSLGPIGYLQIPGTPVILQWGSRSVARGANPVTFPFSYPAVCWQVFLSAYGNPDGGDEADEPIWASPPSPQGFTMEAAGDRVTIPVGWLAIGR